MADSTLYAALAGELNSALAGGKIDKVNQPSRDLVLLTVRIRGESRRLLLSASPSFSRIHITEAEFEKMPEPPMFCMLLRKHLTGAVIEKIEQLNHDRIICLSLNYADEYGRAFREKLYSEMVPGKINIVLVDEDGMIIDCIYRRDYEPDLYRRVFPGMVYHLPRQPENYNRNSSHSSDYSADPAKIAAGSAKEAKAFSGEGFPSVSAFLDAYYSEREKQDLYRRRTRELRTSLSSARKRIEKKLAAQRLELKRTEGREAVRRNADLITANIYRIHRGDPHLVCEDFYQEGCPETTVPLDPLKSPQENASRLYKQYNKLKTAEEYLVDLIDKAEQQLDYIESAVDELERAGSNADIEGIQNELAASGIIRSRAGSGTSDKNRKNGNNGNGNCKGNGNGNVKGGKGNGTGCGSVKGSKGNGKGSKGNASGRNSFSPVRVETKDGLEILIGRNNLQNDELTFRIARKTDLWFHVKNYHGSHVILRTLGSAPSDEDILQAARLAASSSQAAALFQEKNQPSASGIHTPSGGIEVDYTFVRNVHKPSGALPGKVIYTDQKTVTVQPGANVLSDSH